MLVADDMIVPPQQTDNSGGSDAHSDGTNNNDKGGSTESDHDDHKSARDKCGAIILEIRERLSKLEERTVFVKMWSDETFTLLLGYINILEGYVKGMYLICQLIGRPSKDVVGMYQLRQLIGRLSKRKLADLVPA